MSITQATATRNALAGTAVHLLDAAATPGTLVFATSGGVEVATLTFAKPAFGTPVNGVAVAAPIAPDGSATGGSVAIAKLLDGNGVEVMRCAVTGIGGGGDIEITSTTVSPTQQVSVSNLSYTASP